MSQLDIQLQPLTLLTFEDTSWEPKTPHNLVELASQTTHLKDRIVCHQNSSPTPINNALDQLLRGAQTMVHSAVLIKAEVQALQQANEVASQRKKRKKKKRIQEGGCLTTQEGQDILAHLAIEEQISRELQQGSRVERQQRRCRMCSKTRHNARTCQRDNKDTIE